MESSKRNKGKPLVLRKRKLKMSPAPKVVKKAAPQSVIGKKPIYQSSPAVPKIKHLEAARCAIPPLNTILNAGIINLDTIASHIVGHLNFAKGAVPIGGTAYNAGAVSLYLHQCLYAYLARAGVVEGDTSFALTFAKYRVPTLVAVLFQHCAPYQDKKLGNTITCKFADFTASYINGLSKSESLNHMWVSGSAISGYGGETTYGPGVSVTTASFTDTEWQSISEWIGLGFETVPITEIGLLAPSHYGLVHHSGEARLKSLKPIVGAIAFYSITDLSSEIGPYMASVPPVSIDSSYFANGSFYLWGYALWSTAHIKYKPDLTPSIVFRRQKINPLMFSLHYVSQSIPKLILNVIDFMNTVLLMGTSTTWGTTQYQELITLVSISYGRALASMPYFCRMNSSSTVYPVPQYSTPTYFSLKVPAYESARGFLPTRSHDTVVCPWIPAPARSVWNVVQNGDVITAAWETDDVLNNAFGNWPISFTSTTTVLWENPVLPITTITNVVPLRFLEELEGYAASYSTVWGNNTNAIKTEKEFCPCACPHFNGANNYTASSNLTILYPLIPYVWCSRPVDTLSCKTTMACSLSNSKMISLFWQPVYDVAQNPVRAASDGSFLTNNLFQFNMANSSPGNLSKSITDAFGKFMLGDSEKVPLAISGKQLIKAAHQYIAEGSPMHPPPSPDFWSSMLSNSYNLYELISKTAAGIQYVTPGVLGAVEAAKVLQTYKPLLALV